MFGPHLTLDLYECKKEKLNDVDLIFKLLDELPEFLGLTKLSTPIVNYYTHPTPGISGFVIISESHISIHTFAEEQFASIDILSCKKFDIKKATDYLVKTFEAKRVEKNLLMRGRHYPIEIRKAIQLVLKQREESLEKT